MLLLIKYIKFLSGILHIKPDKNPHVWRHSEDKLAIEVIMFTHIVIRLPEDKYLV